MASGCVRAVSTKKSFFCWHVGAGFLSLTPNEVIFWNCEFLAVTTAGFSPVRRVVGDTRSTKPFFCGHGPEHHCHHPLEARGTPPPLARGRSTGNHRCSAQRDQNSKRSCRCRCCCCSSCCCCCSGCCCSIELLLLLLHPPHSPQKHRSTPQQHDRPPLSTAALRMNKYVPPPRTQAPPSLQNPLRARGGATAALVAQQRRSLVVCVCDRRGQARRRSSSNSNRSWTRSSWSAPCILQLQGASLVALRFLLRFPAFSQNSKRTNRAVFGVFLAFCSYQP